ncbi:DUF6268 family outer membrane beta-barrel protein [Dysgonomonas sp. ZJ709]|uniref:DUF6268 family outer membrane beta-barrel protein n=1 Tax=Dysgonomonas sp. ZJ709 TaxID=2709797 RepID=UPI0013EDB60F|nr:DUF6268 family outer membrane beta-barrel protein [Dysgonomonas sp. ZJ709]
MKLTLYSIVFFLTVTCTYINAQITVKTEYLGKSSLLDPDKNKIEDSKGGALVYKGGINLPLSMKVDENNRPTVWGIGAAGTYVSFENENISKDLFLSEMMNLELALFHMRPINDKWSMMASAGFGIYTPNTRFSQIRFKNVLGNVGVTFIRHLKPNLEIGGGLAINNTFGYPMIFPALYFNWMYEGRFTFKLSMMNGGELLALYNVNESLSLSLVAEMSGQGALLEKDGKDIMFSHQYAIMGFRPEIKINKRISIPITVGMNATRSVYYTERKLRAIFKSDSDLDFKESFYASMGLRIRF